LISSDLGATNPAAASDVSATLIARIVLVYGAQKPLPETQSALPVSVAFQWAIDLNIRQGGVSDMSAACDIRKDV